MTIAKYMNKLEARVVAALFPLTFICASEYWSVSAGLVFQCAGTVRCDPTPDPSLTHSVSLLRQISAMPLCFAHGNQKVKGTWSATSFSWPIPSPTCWQAQMDIASPQAEKLRQPVSSTTLPPAPDPKEQIASMSIYLFSPL